MDDTRKTSDAAVYVVLGVILLVVIGAGVYFMNKTSEANNTPEERSETTPSQVSKPSLKGQKLSDTNFAGNAVQIYPGNISREAMAAMSGWDLKTVKQSDGTIKASLVPTGSEAGEGDSAHTFTLNSGDKLYFVDINPGDDQPGQDNIKSDDMGIVVDANGIIQ